MAATTTMNFTYKYKLIHNPTMAKFSFVHCFESGRLKNFATLFPLCFISVAVLLFFLTCSFTPSSASVRIPAPDVTWERSPLWLPR